MSMREEKRAWIVFSGHTDMAWLKILRRGFRHCAVILHDGAHWINVDPLSSTMEVSVSHVPASFNLPLWMENQGYKVVAVPVFRAKTAAPWGLFSCVEVVKRVLGIRGRWILTPWQLYRYALKIQNMNIETEGEQLWGV